MIKRRFARLDGYVQEIIKGASLAFVVKALGTALGFAFNVALARLLGADGVGVYLLALSMATCASVIGQLGLGNTLLRLVASSSDSGKWEEVRAVSRLAFLLVLPILFLMSILLYGVAPWLAEEVFSKSTLVDPMRWMALAITPLGLLQLNTEKIKGLKKIVLSLSLESIWLPLFNIGGIFLLASQFGVLGATLSYGISATITAGIGFLYWHRIIPKSREHNVYFSLSKLLKICLPLLGIAIVNRVFIPWLPFFFLGVWASSSDVGFFGMANRTASLVSIILISVNSIAAPKFSALFHRKDIDGLQSVVRTTTMLMVLVATPVLAVFLVAPSWMMGFFGDEFSAAGSLLVILAIGQFVNVITGSVGYLLMMTGHERSMFKATTLALFLNVLLSILLIPSFGAVGAAIATASSISVANILRMHYVRKELGIIIYPSINKG